MNTIYKVVYNAATNTWVAAPEFAKGRGKQGKLRKSAVALALVLAIGTPFGAAMASETCELPDGQIGIQNEEGVCESVADTALPGAKAIAPRAFNDAYISIAGGGAASVTGTTGDIAIGGASRAVSTSADAWHANIAIGHSSVAEGGNRAIAVGLASNASATDAIGMGFSAQADAVGAVAIGSNSNVTGANSVALGISATASAAGSVALGNNSVANRANSVSVGSATLQRQIVNVAAGTQNTDAANFGQLRSTADSIADAIGGGSVVNADGTVSAPSYSVGGTTVNSIGDAITNIDGRTTANTTNITNLTNNLESGAVGLVKQDAATNAISVAGDKAGTSVDFAGTEGMRTVSGLRDATLAAGSSEAVTGSQLFATNANVTNNSTAITNLGDRVTINEGDITNIKTQIGEIGDGAIGLVKQDATTNEITVASDKGGTSVNFAGTDGARTLSGVAAGTLSSTSDEAVNGSQLFATNTNVTNLGSRVTINEGDITNIKDQIGEIGEGTIGLVKQDATTNEITVASDKAGTVVNFAGTDGARTLAGVEAGELSATSDEAVNGSQLFDTNERVGAVEGDITTINTNMTNLGNQVTSIDGRVTNIEGDLNNGTIGMVRQDAATGHITVATAFGGTSVDFTGTDGARVLSGVANGVNDQDAATIAQLKASGLVDPNDGRALGALVYDDMSLERATLGGTNGTVIANVANGLIAVGSREAVNGGQLASIRDDLQKQIGDVGDRVGVIEDGIADGSIGGPGGGDGGPVEDNGGKPIHNVGDGVADSDAANVGQVNQKFEQAVSTANAYTDTKFNQLQDDFNAFQSDVDRRFENVDSRIDRMAALSGAYAGMAMNTAGLNGKNRVGVGVGAQGGKAALAVGYQRIVGKSNNASVSIGGASSGSEKSISAGAGFSW